MIGISPRARRLAGFAGLTLVYLAAYLLLDRTTRTFQTLPGVSPWYPPNALSLALLFIFGVRMFPLVLLASFLSNALIWELAVAPVDLVILSAIPSLGYTLAAFVMRRVLHLDPQLRLPREAVQFISIVLLVPVPIAAAEAAESIQARIIAPTQFTEAVREYWVGDVVGLLTLVPFLTVVLIPGLTWLWHRARELRSPGWELRRAAPEMVEILGISGATILIGWMLLDLQILGATPLVYPLFLPLIWSAMRFGMSGAAAANLGIGVTSMLFLSMSAGSELELSELQLFISLLSATGLVLGAVVSRERGAEFALRESEEQYRQVFESSNDCLIVLDSDRAIVDSNPAAANLFGFSEQELADLDPIELVANSYRPYFGGYLDLALAGDHLQLRVQCIRKSGEQFEASIATTPTTISGKTHVLVVVRDVTQDVRLLELLEELVDQRTSELGALLNASRAVAEHADLEQSIPRVLHALNSILAVQSIQLYSYSDRGLVHLLDYRHPEVQWQRRLLTDTEQAELLAASGLTLPGDGPTQDTSSDRRQLHQLDQPGLSVRPQGADALLVSSDRVQGILRVTFPAGRDQSENEERLIAAFAGQLSVALDNARLLAESRDRLSEAVSRRQVSESLASIMRAVNSVLSLSDLLQVIVEQAAQTLNSDGVALFRLLPGEEGLAIRASLGLPEEFSRVTGLPSQLGAVGRAVTSNEPVLMTDLQGILSQDLQHEAARKFQSVFEWIIHSYDTILSVPLQVRGEIYGGISLYYRDQTDIGQEHVDLATAFSAQAALALENSRLAEHSRWLATLQERQRIARDLHDSVSQALYGLTLGARTAHHLAEGTGSDLEQAVAYIRELAETALSEMRGLIYELRPEVLQDQGLHEALRRLTSAVAERHNVGVTLEGPPQAALPPEVEEALFRIAQEGLQNAIRHAQATEIEIRFTSYPGHVLMEIEDNGRGFDPQSVEPGHFGLLTMQERAENHGGRLEIESVPDQGTLLRLKIPVRVARESDN